MGNNNQRALCQQLWAENKYLVLSHSISFNHLVSYRNTREFTTKSIVNSNIMLELASKKARDTTTTKLNRRNLERSLPDLRKLTRQDPEVFPQRLSDILLDCGVVLVGLPALPNANLNGATKKLEMVVPCFY